MIVSSRVATPNEESAYHAGVDHGRREALKAQPVRMTKAEAAAKASHGLHARTMRRAARAAELQAAGRTRREIGELIAQEEGQPTAFPVSTVRDWIRSASRGKPSS